MRKLSFVLFFSTLAVAGLLLAVRLLLGPFHGALIGVNSPVNAASAIAVSFVMLCLVSGGGPYSVSSKAGGWIAFGVTTAAVVAAAFWPNLRAPFVYDDYTHIVQASHAGW